jgi:hypothetical protein
MPVKPANRRRPVAPRGGASSAPHLSQRLLCVVPQVRADLVRDLGVHVRQLFWSLSSASPNPKQILVAFGSSEWTGRDADAANSAVAAVAKVLRCMVCLCPPKKQLTKRALGIRRPR